MMRQGLYGWDRNTNIFQQQTIFLERPAPATSNYGVLNLGDGPFDVASVGKFSGNANGTYLGINAISTYTGNLADWQRGGASTFLVDKSGYLTLGGSQIIGQLLAPTNLAASAGGASPGAFLAGSTTYYYVLTCVDYNGNETGPSLLASYVEPGTPTKVDLTWTVPSSPLAKFVNIYKTSSASVTKIYNFLAQVSPRVTSYTDDGTVDTTAQAVPGWSRTGSLSIVTNAWVNTNTTADALSPGSILITDANTNRTLGLGMMRGSPLGVTSFGMASSDRLCLYSPVSSSGISFGLGVAGAGGVIGLHYFGSGRLGIITGGSDSVLMLQTAGSSTQSVQMPSNPKVASNRASVCIGDAPWDGSTSGFFSGSSGGTYLAVNAVSAFAGNLVDWQVFGVSKFSVDPSGNTAMAGHLNLAATPLAALAAALHYRAL